MIINLTPVIKNTKNHFKYNKRKYVLVGTMLIVVIAGVLYIYDISISKYLFASAIKVNEDDIFNTIVNIVETIENQVGDVSKMIVK